MVGLVMRSYADAGTSSGLYRGADESDALSPEDQQIFRKSTFPEDWYRRRILNHLSDSVSACIFVGRGEADVSLSL